MKALAIAFLSYVAFIGQAVYASDNRATSEHDASTIVVSTQVDEISRCPEGWYINTFTYNPTAPSNQFGLTCYTFTNKGALDSSAPDTTQCLSCIQGASGGRYDLNSSQSSSLGYCIFYKNQTSAVCP